MLGAAASMLWSSYAWALGCADIPGAEVDPGLDAFTPLKSYGRLLPEFKSRQNTEELRRTLIVERVVGHRLQLPNDKGIVTLKLEANGSVAITAALASGTIRQATDARRFGFDNADYLGQLARTFFALGIKWRNYAEPPPASLGLHSLPAKNGVTRIGQTTHELKGAPLISHHEAVSYSCSSNAAYVGDHNNLSSLVVLKGTLRAVQTTTTTTTDQILHLTINDLVRQKSASIDDTIVLLNDFPDLVQALRDLAKLPAADGAAETDAGDDQKILTGIALADRPVAEHSPVTPAASAQSDNSPSPTDAVARAPSTNWVAILVTLAIICAMVLLVLYQPRFTPRRRRDIVTPSAQVAAVEEAPAPAVEEAAPQVSSTPDKPDKSLDARIAVLETLRSETETFQEKLQEALTTAASDAEDTKQVKDKLTRVQRQLVRVTNAKAKLEEAAQDDRSKLHAASEDARKYKELVIDLKTRLARATAQVESSQSVIIELESASQMAIELNADYRATAEKSDSENTALRSRIELLEQALAERDDLLKSTNKTNEEIRNTLVEERAGRAAAENDVNDLSRDLETLRQESEVKLKRASFDAFEAEHALRSTKESLAGLERELEEARREHSQLELDRHAKLTENARLRVDHGVKARLLENNVSELSAHIENLEKLLRDNGIKVPELALAQTNRAESERDVTDARADKRDTAGGNIVELRTTRADRS